MPSLKFTADVNVVTTALGLPGHPYIVRAGYLMENVSDETAASAKKIYEDRVEIIPDKPTKATKEK